MELAILVAEVKLIESGEESLNATDRGHLERARMIDVSRCELVHATRSPLPRQPPNSQLSPQAVTEALTRAGIEMTFLELTRPDLGFPVVRAFAPTLQPMPSVRVTDRLMHASREWGGGRQYTHNLDLMQ
jgi:ribosomal protein S12 methylthiotransferase accessory factor YcaO